MTGMNEYTLLRRDQAGRVATQAAQFVALSAGVAALETEAAQEGRRLLLEAAIAAGLDIKALGWQDTTLM